jgi:hypothetical protein
MRRVRTDGRDIDPKTGILSGEAASQRSHRGESLDQTEKAETWITESELDPHDPTYYDRPLLQESVWTWAVPLYYYVGGVSGASAVLGAALQLRDAKGNSSAILRCHTVSTVGTFISGVLLIYDLGRPERFLNMLRVFRPTSPMSVGAWVLTACSGSSATAMAFGDSLFGKLAGLSAGLLGTALATYTGVLVGNTAVPVWSASRRTLPLLFGASAISSTGSLFDLMYNTPATRTFGNIGRVCELAAALAMEREASRVEYVARPLKRGLSGTLWKAGAIFTAASLAASLFPKQNRGTRLAAGILGTLGALSVRFAVERAGVQSARDPRSTFREQRG